LFKIKNPSGQAVGIEDFSLEILNVCGGIDSPHSKFYAAERWSIKRRGNKMTVYKTKHFGKLTIDENNNKERAFLRYKETIIGISMFNCNKYGENIKICFEIIDKYFEINEMGKKAIMENFDKNENIKKYFRNMFNTYGEKGFIEIFGIEKIEKLNIKKIIREIHYPDINFDIENDKIILSINYNVDEYKYLLDKVLCVKMDEGLNIIEIKSEYN
jgi:hypothetical protein